LIIPFVLLTLVFFFMSNYASDSIREHFYMQGREEALKLAEGYSHSIVKSVEFSEISNQLLEEKLETASKMSVFYDGLYTEKRLKKMAENLNVDVIYVYNSQGRIIYSSTGEYIGWKAEKGHPVYEYMKSGKKLFIEDIRKDTESDFYYKYAYFRALSGSFVQIGVLADRIQFFKESFEIQQVLSEIKNNQNIVQTCFFDKNFVVQASTLENKVGETLEVDTARESILNQEEYYYINTIDGKKNYDIFVPVELDEDRIGTLFMRYSLQNIEILISEFIFGGFIFLNLLYGVLLFVLIYIYRKNKALIDKIYYDNLTGTANKYYLTEFLEKKIADNTSQNRAILLVNCSDFNFVNLTYGYEFGDRLLKKIAEKLTALTTDDIMLFRFTSDRFVFYLEDYDHREELSNFAEKIETVFKSPFKINSSLQYINVQIGIVELNDNYDHVDRLLKNVSITINNLNKDDNLSYAFFNDEMEREVAREEIIEREIRRAVEEGNSQTIYLKFQPLIDAKSGKIVSFEALARMESDHFGQISPLEFIDIAERKQLIIPLSNFILKQALIFSNKLYKTGYHNLKISVNISGIELWQDDFTEKLLDMISEVGAHPENLVIEITESVILNNFELVNEKLQRLQQEDIGIALDDFGTGYSSFYRLRELNLNIIKIDRYFVNIISDSDPDKNIIGDIISMAHKLGLKVIAEGVELESERGYLIEHGCDVLQGYMFSKPVIMDEALKMLKEDNL
ncbi:MAG: putative bifunctional diguanylate cyclase/phosphodiesterase, partial [Bacillota bacterium]